MLTYAHFRYDTQYSQLHETSNYFQFVNNNIIYSVYTHTHRILIFTHHTSDFNLNIKTQTKI